MSKTAITSSELAPPVGPFSQAIEVGGFLYFSGQVAQDPATGKLVEGGIVAEAEGVFRNLSAVLKAAGKRFDDVVRARRRARAHLTRPGLTSIDRCPVQNLGIASLPKLTRMRHRVSTNE